MVVAAIILNLLDAVFTLIGITSGAAVEANPLMNALLAISPTVFVTGKLALVYIGLAVLWRLRERRSAASGIIGAVAVYAGVLVYHLTMFAPMVLS